MSEPARPERNAALLDAEDGRLLDQLLGLRWPAQQHLRDAVPGAHMARRLGPGAELSEYREYRPGDETGRVDWKLLARTDRAFVRLSHSHSRISTMVLLDASASMAWPQDTLAKWRQARRLALGLAAAVQQAGDPVGVLAVQGSPDARTTADASQLSSPKLHILAPRTQEGTLQQIAHLLRRIESQGSVALAPMLARCQYQRLVIVSDFLANDADAAALLAGAGEMSASGREVIALHVIDDDELNPPRTLEVLHDSENTSLLRHMSVKTRTGYQQAFGRWRETLAREWRRRGAWFSAVTTQEPAAQAVRRIVKGMAAPEHGRSV